MPPKKQDKQEIIIHERNVGAMTDDELVEFQNAVRAELEASQKETALMDLQVDLLRTAWESIEDKLEDGQFECQLIRAEMDAAKMQFRPIVREKRKKINKTAVLRFFKEELFARVDEAKTEAAAPPPRISFEERKLPGGGKLRKGESRGPTVMGPRDYVEREAATTREIKRFIVHARKTVANAKIKQRKDKLVRRVRMLKRRGLSIIDVKLKDKAKLAAERKAGGTSKKDGSPRPVPLWNKLKLKKGKPGLSDVAIDDVTDTRRPPTLEQLQINKMAADIEKLWEVHDPRYDDNESCCKSHDSIDSRLIDDFNPNPDDDVEDARHFDQMRKFLELEYKEMEDNLQVEYHKRMDAMRKVWQVDVRQKLVTSLNAIANDVEVKKNLMTKQMFVTDNEFEEKKRQLQAKLNSLDEARKKEIEKRHDWRMNYLKDKTDMERMMIAEKYDEALEMLKKNHSVVFLHAQRFFRETAETDINLIYGLKNEQDKLKKSIKMMEGEIRKMKVSTKELKGPLEEYERETKWLETKISAMEKDLRSMRHMETINRKLKKEVEKMSLRGSKIKAELNGLNRKEAALVEMNERVISFHENVRNGCGATQYLDSIYRVDTRKMKAMEARLLQRGLVDEASNRSLKKFVLKRVDQAKEVKWNRRKEAKAFNELVSQFEIRSKDLLIPQQAKADRMATSYRRMNANLLTTFDDEEKVSQRSVKPLWDKVESF